MGNRSPMCVALPRMPQGQGVYVHIVIPAMAVAQLNRRSSLYDLVICLHAYQEELYHVGLARALNRRMLAKANEKCECGNFELVS